MRAVTCWIKVQQVPTYNLVLERREGYLYACVTAKIITLQTVVEYLNRIAQAVRESRRESQLGRLLFVRRTPLMDSTTDYELAANLLRNMLPPGTSIAIVDENDNDPGEAKRKLQVLSNRGLNARAFSNVADAEAWLLDGRRQSE
jgi:hypothetical protein